jgi:hypothetical protein
VHSRAISVEYARHLDIQPVLFHPVPFEEDHANANVWFLDHDYLESMAGMFRKVNGKNVI